jgi:hypothetical protein
MATFTARVTGENELSFPSSWDADFEVTNLTDVISSSLPTSILVDRARRSTNLSFNPISSSFIFYNQPLTKYASWRDSTIAGTQHPSTGLSLDIWSDDLCILISSGATYSDLLNNVYTLNPDKWTLCYNYSFLNTFHYGKGGTIEFF